MSTCQIGDESVQCGVIMSFFDLKQGSNTHSKSGTGKQIFEKHHLHFIGYFSGIFLITVLLLAIFRLLPSELQENSEGNSFVESVEHSALEILQGSESNKNITTTSNNNTNANNTIQNNKNNQVSQNPIFTATRLYIPIIDVNTVIRNPVSDSIKTLDYELTQGAVRYPGSGTVGSGNMFLFGHSTSFSVVQNKAYKVFNELKTLNAGDEIYVDAYAKLPTGSTIYRTYVYKVRDVTKVNKDETLIKFDTTQNMITLSTCNSFGAKTDRYVVQADFVQVK